VLENDFTIAPGRADRRGNAMIYRFGAFAIDTEAYELQQDGSPVAVEPQVFDLLVLLIENNDRIVTRDEIIERVWKGRIVSDAAISSRIKAARRAIGDDGKAQGLIRTVHRRGLRFVGDVVIEGARLQELDAIQVEPSLVSFGTEAPHLIDRSTLLVGNAPAPSGTSLSLGVDATDSATGLDLSLPNRPSLVVLPFQLLGGDESGQIMADGLSLDIMTRLARTRWLFVISRGSAFMFRNSTQDVKNIALRLGVRYVVQGDVQFLGSRIRIRAALTDAVAMREVWAEHFDRNVDDIFDIQDEIANVVVGAVEGEIEQTERQRALLTHPTNLDAWSAYHRATWLMYQFTPEGYVEAERLFKLAARLDPNASRVFAGLSFVHWQRAFLEIGKDRNGEIKQALEYAQKALNLDPREPQGHWALGRAFLLQEDFDLALEEIEHSIKLNPNFAIGHYFSAFTRLLDSDYEGTGAAVQQARRLSPYDMMSFAMLATQAVNSALVGNGEEAAILANRAARQPNAHYHIHAIAALCNAIAQRHDIARQYIGQLAKIHPGYRINDYFRAFPYRSDTVRQTIRSEFLKLGLKD
jgi:TolB-like protein/DNA-binding winged helix-turn-helix (wHTH) protein